MLPKTIHYADLWHAGCTAQLPTATNAQPMTTIDAFRQDALTPQTRASPTTGPHGKCGVVLAANLRRKAGACSQDVQRDQWTATIARHVA